MQKTLTYTDMFPQIEDSPRQAAWDGLVTVNFDLWTLLQLWGKQNSIKFCLSQGWTLYVLLGSGYFSGSAGL